MRRGEGKSSRESVLRVAWRAERRVSPQGRGIELGEGCGSIRPKVSSGRFISGGDGPGRRRECLVDGVVPIGEDAPQLALHQRCGEGTEPTKGKTKSYFVLDERSAVG